MSSATSPLLVGDPGHRDDLGGMHDGGVQAGVDAFVEKHRIEHDASRRVQTEGDIGQAQRRLDIGEEPLHLREWPRSSRCRPGGFPLVQVAIGKVRQSRMMSLSRSPKFCVMSVIARCATRTFHSAVRA
jgi:hypothetical protein